ncbi:MAG: hypothetical protein J6A97_10100 [Clostridia bacterium]|nr:hypothetical protein [Clostridia bacterium]
MICTFFGHKDAPKQIEKTLREKIEELILTENVNYFYVGNNGNFDSMVSHILRDLSEKYDITYRIVLAYMPDEKNRFDDSSNTILPEGIESVPKRFAISWRNKWMIKQSDFVVTYVTRTVGGAAQFKQLAEKKNKTVISV